MLKFTQLSDPMEISLMLGNLVITLIKQYLNFLNQLSSDIFFFIVNDTIMALGRGKKPAGNDQSDRYFHLSAILAA